MIRKGLMILMTVLVLAGPAYTQKDSTQIGGATTMPETADQPTREANYQKVKLGVFGDLGLSWLKPKSDEYTSQGIRFSYNYGLVVDINFTENYTFSTGLNVNSYGGKLDYSDSVIYDENKPGVRGLMSRKYRINYIELPLLLKLKTNQMGYFTPFVQLGLRNSFRLSALADESFIFGGETHERENVDMVDESAFYTLGFTVGFGTEYAISRSFSAFAVLSYDNGLTTVLNGENFLDDGTKSKQTAMFKKFGLTIGFLF
jgi:hypothetical protein